MCLLKLLKLKEANPHWLHLWDFSPECVFKCSFKAHFQLDVYSHWSQTFNFFPFAFLDGTLASSIPSFEFWCSSLTSIFYIGNILPLIIVTRNWEFWNLCIILFWKWKCLKTIQTSCLGDFSVMWAPRLLLTPIRIAFTYSHKNCLGGFPVTWVPKLLLLPVKIRIFGPKNGQIWP